MGERRIVDKTIGPAEIVRALQAGNITTAQAQQMFNGVMPIGDFKGAAAILDLDALVKQPLVLAEQLHILGVLDGREEDYDLQTLTIPNGALVNTVLTGDIPEDGVPSGQVWYIGAVVTTLPADAGGTPTGNWHCSLWTDRAASPSPYGQPFHATDLNMSPGGGIQYDEFTYPGNWWALTNKQVPLRLPAGAKLTFRVVNTGAVATGNMACTCAIYGWIGKALVE